MKTTTLVLNHLLPRESAELGRLVTNIHDPAQDYCPNEPLLLPKHAITTHELQNFDAILQNSKGSNLFDFLTAFLAGGWTQSRETITRITSPSFVTHQLTNCEDFLQDACSLPSVRAWVERAARRRQRVYIITGLKVLKDAHIRQGIVQSSGLKITAEIPGPALTSALGVGPIPNVDGVLDVRAGNEVRRDSKERGEYLAAGEHVFAIQYRKLRLKTLSRRQVDLSDPLGGSKWKIYVATRGPSADEDEDRGEALIDVDVGDPLAASDIHETCEQFEIDNENVLFYPRPVRRKVHSE